VDFHEIWYADDAIEDDLDSILFSAVASPISKWRSFKRLGRARLWSRLVDWMKFYMELMALNIVFCMRM
jgi:hypothetical protein